MSTNPNNQNEQNNQIKKSTHIEQNKYTVVQDEQKLKKHLKSDDTKQNIGNKLEDVKDLIKDTKDMATQSSNIKKENEDLTQFNEREKVENIPSYLEALKHLDKEYHQFEHNWNTNINQYPSNQIDEMQRQDNPNFERKEVKDFQNVPQVDKKQ